MEVLASVLASAEASRPISHLEPLAWGMGTNVLFSSGTSWGCLAAVGCSSSYLATVPGQSGNTGLGSRVAILPTLAWK